MTSERVYTLIEASEVTGVSMPTIRRRKDVLIGAGAVADPKGWRIPHQALVVAGLLDGGEVGDESPQEPLVSVPEMEAAPTDAEELQAAKDRIRRLESENQILRHHVDKWQTIARERLESLNDMRVAFRALAMTRPQPELEAKPAEPAPEQPAEEPKPRGWWSRTFG